MALAVDTEYLIECLGALFAIMNPFMTLPFFLSLTDRMEAAAQRRIAVATVGYAPGRWCPARRRICRWTVPRCGHAWGSMTRSVAVVGLAVWLASACDPNDVPAQSVQQAAGVLQAVQDAKAERAANASDDFDACMGNCGAGAGATADDRATCRLTCQDAGGVAPPDASVAKAVLLRFDTCANGCIANASASDIATCRLQCTQSASRGPEAEAMGAEQRKCSTACLDALVTCDGGCGAPGADASTCRVHCEVDVTRCLARCG